MVAALEMPAVASQAIRHRRVPIIHGANVVLAKDERHASGLAEAAIGEGDSVGLYELCRRGLVGMHHNTRSFVIFLEPHPVRARGLLSRNRRRSALWALRSARSP